MRGGASVGAANVPRATRQAGIWPEEEPKPGLQPDRHTKTGADEIHAGMLSDEAVSTILGRMRSFERHEQRIIAEPKCEVRRSRVHGLGLFATKHIEAWECVTLYPADGITVYLSLDDRDTRCIKVKKFAGMTPDVCALYSAKALFNYLGREVEIVGDPASHDDPMWAGHMANDRVRMTHGHQAGVYSQVSQAGSNAQIAPLPFPESMFKEDLVCCVAVLATRDIEPGEEVFVTYGDEYWTKTLRWFEEQAEARPATRTFLDEMD